MYNAKMIFAHHILMVAGLLVFASTGCRSREETAAETQSAIKSEDELTDGRERTNSKVEARGRLVSQVVQVADDSLLVAVQQQVAALGIRSANSEEFKLLAAPIAVPSTFKLSSLSDDPLYQLWSVPTVNEAGKIQLTGPSVSSLISKYLQGNENIMEGKKAITQETKALVANATTLLYEDPQTRKKKTAAYEEFEKWNIEREKLASEISTEANESLKRILSGKLNRLDEDYMRRNVLVDGREVSARQAILNAVDIVDSATKFEVGIAQQLEEARKLSNASGESIAHQELYQQLTSSTWRKLRVSGKDISGSLKLVLGRDLIEASVSEVVFELKVVDVAHPVLALPFFANRQWKHKSGAVLSNGGDSGTQAETIPRYISRAIFIRNLDLAIVGDNEELIKHIFETPRPSAGGVPFETDGPGAAYLLPGHLVIPRPLVVSVELRSMPKSPNPDAKLVW